MLEVLRARIDAASAALIVPVAFAGGALVGAVAASPRFAGEVARLLGLEAASW